MVCGKRFSSLAGRMLVTAAVFGALVGVSSRGQSARQGEAKSSTRERARPKLVVLLVVDQMRGDYVDKFLGQWSGGLKRMVEEGAWFHEAAYPYAATETCAGHATISTGAFPATHGMVANAWWDRDSKKMVTCTGDPDVKNVGYVGAAVSGGDSAWRMEVPAFADELKYQSGGPTRVVTLSLKARAAITMAGRTADEVTWFEPSTGTWATSDKYGTQPFVEEYVKRHPVAADYGKTWNLALPRNAYLYEEKAAGTGPPPGWGPILPHQLNGKIGSADPDKDFYQRWEASPFADSYLAKMGEAAVSALHNSNTGETDFLAISFSSPDYIGHAFGPRSWEIQDALVQLDRDLGEFFAVLDKEVGRGNYVVALSADHGVAPIPEDMKKGGGDAGWLNMADVRGRVEKALEPFQYPKPAVATVTGDEIYFVTGVYDQLKSDPKAMQATLEAIQNVPGVLRVYRSEDVEGRPVTEDPIRKAFAASYFAGRSGDLFVAPKAYWPVDYLAAGKERSGGTTHGTPYNYDQHVPLLLMGWGIRSGNYYRAVTPADIAPTFAALCGITLASPDGKVLAEALQNNGARNQK
jgi:predicted AlkP superfamily pyrophosphatase or phosphodiesterase